MTKKEKKVSDQEKTVFEKTDYERIFHPRRIAIIGVSTEDDGTGFGSGMYIAISSMGFEGTIYLVNPRGGTFKGLTVYKSVEDIPEQIDFAVIAVSARHVPGVLEACLKKGAVGAEILSSGFSELGTQEGKELEKQVQEVAAKGIRVVGPNCFGIYCPASGLTLLPGPDLSRESGPVGFMAQSGGITIDLAHAGKWMGLRFSKMISFGNGCDLRETDLLRYFRNDAETGVIAMYIEGIKDGELFFSELKATAARKPVVVLKGGLSQAGARSVASHTASLGGSRVIWQSALKQAGAVQVNDTEELAQTSLAFALLPPKKYPGISIVGGGGAIGVTACDTAEAYGIDIPPLLPEIKARIDDILPKPGSSAINPVDVANPFVSPKVLKQVLLHAAGDERVELQIIVSLFFHYQTLARISGRPVKEVVPYRELAEAVRDVIDQTGKPVMAVLPNAKRGPEYMDVVEMIALARKEYTDRGIAVFDEFHHAIRAVANVNRYYAKRLKEK